MTILIDGHNLIGQMQDLQLDDPHDEAQLVARLKVYRSIVREPITVVFDAGEAHIPRQGLSGGGVEVVFATERASADDIIVARIARTAEPRSVLVVSSDREIRAAARRAGARIMTSEDFAARMAQPQRPRPGRRRAAVRERPLSAREVDEWMVIFRDRPGK